MPDAIVIGGGVIGLLCARELRAGGLAVTLLERDHPGRQASWASAGIVSDRLPHDIAPTAQLRAYSVSLFPRLADDLREETGMDVEYTQNGYLLPAFSEAEAAALHAEHEAMRSGGHESGFVAGDELRQMEPALGPAVIAARFGPGGNVENRRLCRALEMALLRAGVAVVSGAPVTEILNDGTRVLGVATPNGTYQARIVVNCAGSWSGAIPGCVPRVPVRPQRGQILSLQRDGIPLQRVVLKAGGPYLVPRVDGRLIVGATREFVGYDSRLTAGGVSWLLSEAIGMVPALADAPIVEMWTGFRPASADDVPSIGRGALDGLYFATGHGPSGIAPAPGTARLLAALVLGQQLPIPAEPFSPMRFA